MLVFCSVYETLGMRRTCADVLKLGIYILARGPWSVGVEIALATRAPRDDRAERGTLGLPNAAFCVLLWGASGARRSSRGSGE